MNRKEAFSVVTLFWRQKVVKSQESYPAQRKSFATTQFGINSPHRALTIGTTVVVTVDGGRPEVWSVRMNSPHYALVVLTILGAIKPFLFSFSLLLVRVFVFCSFGQVRLIWSANVHALLIVICCMFYILSCIDHSKCKVSSCGNRVQKFCS